LTTAAAAAAWRWIRRLRHWRRLVALVLRCTVAVSRKIPISKSDDERTTKLCKPPRRHRLGLRLPRHKAAELEKAKPHSKHGSLNYFLEQHRKQQIEFKHKHCPCLIEPFCFEYENLEAVRIDDYLNKLYSVLPVVLLHFEFLAMSECLTCSSCGGARRRHWCRYRWATDSDRFAGPVSRSERPQADPHHPAWLCHLLFGTLLPSKNQTWHHSSQLESPPGP
jgi:hypothetical protein